MSQMPKVTLVRRNPHGFGDYVTYDYTDIAMPMGVSDLPHDFWNEEANRHNLTEFRDETPKPILLETGDRYQLFRTKDHFYLVDTQRDYIIYAMKYEKTINGFVQKAVWRQDRSSVTKVTTIVSDVIFDYVLKECHQIITDIYQTQAGNGMWRKLLRDAKHKGFLFGALNTKTRTYILPNKDEFGDDFWDRTHSRVNGEDPSFRDMRYYTRRK